MTSRGSYFRSASYNLQSSTVSPSAPSCRHKTKPNHKYKTKPHSVRNAPGEGDSATSRRFGWVGERVPKHERTSNAKSRRARNHYPEGYSQPLSASAQRRFNTRQRRSQRAEGERQHSMLAEISPAAASVVEQLSKRNTDLKTERDRLVEERGQKRLEEERGKRISRAVKKKRREETERRELDEQRRRTERLEEEAEKRRRKRQRKSEEKRRKEQSHQTAQQANATRLRQAATEVRADSTTKSALHTKTNGPEYDWEYGGDASQGSEGSKAIQTRLREKHEPGSVQRVGPDEEHLKMPVPLDVTMAALQNITDWETREAIKRLMVVDRTVREQVRKTQLEPPIAETMSEENSVPEMQCKLHNLYLKKDIADAVAMLCGDSAEYDNIYREPSPPDERNTLLTAEMPKGLDGLFTMPEQVVLYNKSDEAKQMRIERRRKERAENTKRKTERVDQIMREAKDALAKREGRDMLAPSERSSLDHEELVCSIDDAIADPKHSSSGAKRTKKKNRARKKLQFLRRKARRKSAVSDGPTDNLPNGYAPESHHQLDTPVTGADLSEMVHQTSEQMKSYGENVHKTIDKVYQEMSQESNPLSSFYNMSSGQSLERIMSQKLWREAAEDPLEQEMLRRLDSIRVPRLDARECSSTPPTEEGRSPEDESAAFWRRGVEGHNGPHEQTTKQTTQQKGGEAAGSAESEGTPPFVHRQESVRVSIQDVTSVDVRAAADSSGSEEKSPTPPFARQLSVRRKISDGQLEELASEAASPSPPAKPAAPEDPASPTDIQVTPGARPPESMDETLARIKLQRERRLRRSQEQEHRWSSMRARQSLEEQRKPEKSSTRPGTLRLGSIRVRGPGSYSDSSTPLSKSWDYTTGNDLSYRNRPKIEERRDPVDYTPVDKHWDYRKRADMSYKTRLTDDPPTRPKKNKIEIDWSKRKPLHHW